MAKANFLNILLVKKVTTLPIKNKEMILHIDTQKVGRD